MREWYTLIPEVHHASKMNFKKLYYIIVILLNLWYVLTAKGEQDYSKICSKAAKCQPSFKFGNEDLISVEKYSGESISFNCEATGMHEVLY